MMNDDIVSNWLSRDPDPSTRNELQQLINSNNTPELKERFASRLVFGTAGLRGKVGAGPNRMNRLVIQETALGLGHYLLTQIKSVKEQGVVIGYDGRPDSRRFSEDAASMLMALGIKVYLTHTVAPTPLIAYGIHHLNTAAGIVVTASHNPPEYNGFKVYWSNGAQIISPHDAGIAELIDQAAAESIPSFSLEDGENKNLLVWLEDRFYNDYRQALNRSPWLSNHTKPDTISLSYTAMHGVGAELAEGLLSDAGFTHVFSVQAQREPDGHFPTVNFPNPEEPGAMDLVIAEARKHNATLACANDPDADRFAVAVRTESGVYKMLTGDQVGVLFGHYLLSQAGGSQWLLGTTIVSSSLLEKVVSSFGATYFETLTGFKWLTNVAMDKESDRCRFLFAYEEALGYAVGRSVWDKDGLSALVAFAQMTATLAASGKTIWDQLESIYREHGLYVNAQKNLALVPGSPPIGDALRSEPPVTIAGQKIVKIRDLKVSKTVFADGSSEPIDLPVSDVLIYHLDDGSRVVVRPSGTEPKLKCYYEVVEPFDAKDSLATVQERAEARMNDLIQQHQAALPQ